MPGRNLSTMRKALCAVLLTFGAPLAAYAQSADLVLCDRLAADPSDPDKPADVRGVSELATADIATAVKFCKTAAGSSRRAMYELGAQQEARNHDPQIAIRRVPALFAQDRSENR
jgi:hypothetical protein